MSSSRQQRCRQRFRWQTVVLAAVAVAIVTATAALGGTGAAPRGPTADQAPNIIVIQTDDQDPRSFRQRIMPRTWKLLVKRGTRFTRGFDASALCCPSRASLLTGQYPHNHGIFSDHPGYGALVDKASTLPAWLQAAGYKTAHVGKFLNGYDPSSKRSGKPAPGWSRWATMVKHFGYYDYKLSLDGELRHFGTKPGDYLDDVLTRQAVRFVHDAARRRTPFYLELDYWAPHSGSGIDPDCGKKAPDPGPRDRHAFDDEHLPTPPSFNERDVSDKRRFIRKLPRLRRSDIKTIKRANRCRLASLQPVDRGVRRLYREVKAAQELNDTVFVYLTDNGMLLGEHRVALKKAIPYEEAMRTPYVVLAPSGVLGGVEPPHTISEPVSNIDLAPTFLDLAGADPCTVGGHCRTMDGRTLLPALRGDADALHGRAVLVEGGHGEHACKYRTIRTQDAVYTEYSKTLDPNTGRCMQDPNATELYDLRNDPFELENLYPAKDPQTQLAQQQLAARLQTLQQCSGRTGPDACE